MANVKTKALMGKVDLRVGLTEKLKEFGGHIGYQVDEAHRGNRYAARSCRLLIPLLRKLGINLVVITCDPNNIPSVKTVESLGATLIFTKIVETEAGIFRLTSNYHWQI
jgi:tagatose 1,6-diphosphate aldolase